MTIYAETPRLILRGILPTDDDSMFEMDSDPEVHRFLGNKPVKTIAESRQMINFIRAQYNDHGIGRWAVVEKTTGQFVGWSGLKFVTDSYNGHAHFYDIGYRLIKRYWGKGYATESATAALNYGFDQLKLTKICGMAHVDNSGSNKVLKKIGLNFIEPFDHDGMRVNWYEITHDTLI